MNKPLSQLGEFGVIALIKKGAPLSRRVVTGIGDDTAVCQTSPNKYLLLTTDMLLEDVHFTKEMGAVLIGRKALGCNISDIAAMGGLPTFAVVSLGVPPQLKTRFVEQLYQGIHALAREFGISIVGGDTIKSDKIVINISLVGEVDKKNLVKRSGAKPGDLIFVTGTLGRSLFTRKHLTFTPRIKESQFLVKHFRPNAMIDLSDGLASDLRHIVDQSRVGANLFEEKIPTTRLASVAEALLNGEDYELLFTVNCSIGKKLLKLKRPFCFFHIGEITKQRGVIHILDRQGRKNILRAQGFRHF